MFGLEYDEISGLPSMRKVNKTSIVLSSMKCKPEEIFFMQSCEWKGATPIHCSLAQVNFLMSFM